MTTDQELREWLDSHKAKSTHYERKLTYRGETKTLAEWSKLLELTEVTLRKRLSRGWTVEETLETPKKINKYI